jgi:hypothetical protein
MAPSSQELEPPANPERFKHASAEDLLNVYLIHQRRIHALADAKYQQGHFERDGLVLVRSADLNP